MSPVSRKVACDRMSEAVIRQTLLALQYHRYIMCFCVCIVSSPFVRARIQKKITLHVKMANVDIVSLAGYNRCINSVEKTHSYFYAPKTLIWNFS
jgi:folate-dependent phosphoribosylglycinamide formyltransferase PurN